MAGSFRGRKTFQRKQRDPEWLICIDPGAIVGWAVFFNGRLYSCGYGPYEKVLLQQVAPAACRGKGVFLLEVPVAYPGKKSKSDPNDLIQTTLRGGEFKYQHRLLGLDLEEISPRDWKGNIPKPASAAEEYLITERVMARLDARERGLLCESKSARAVRIDWNLIDAVGMGLWRLAREEETE